MGTSSRVRAKGEKVFVIELRESAVKGDREEMARKELGCEKKTSCVLQ
jgi:hypothetical protein